MSVERFRCARLRPRRPDAPRRTTGRRSAASSSCCANASPSRRSSRTLPPIPQLKTRWRGSRRCAASPSTSSACRATTAIRTYVALDRPYVVWNVVATDGVLRRPAALVLPVRRLRCLSRLFRQGRRGSICGASSPRTGSTCTAAARRRIRRSATSTDPVLSTMVNGGEQYVASLLFHELAHQQLYVKDDSEFSEAFAMVVEELGTERWLSQHGTAGGSRALSTAARSGARSSASSSRRSRLGFVRSMRAARRPSSCATTKSAAFDTLRAEYEALKATLAREHRLRRVVRSAAEQRHARVGRDLYALAAGAARAARRKWGSRRSTPMPPRSRSSMREQREERLRAWEARARARSATSAER